MLTTKETGKGILSLLLGLWLLMGSLTAAAEANIAPREESAKPLVVKVAFCKLPGFFEYDSTGNPVGYGVDYLEELQGYGNFQWEYIPVDSWEDISGMMQAGQVDVCLPVSEPLHPNPKRSYTVEPVITSYHAILTLKSRKDLYYRDYPTIAKLRVGVSRNLVIQSGIRDYLQAIGVLPHLVYFNSYNDSYYALEKGRVDAVITNIMDLNDSLKVLDKFAFTKNYITTLKGNPKYRAINEAMTDLALHNPSFTSELSERYFLDRVVEPFTKEEQEYIAQGKEITIAVFPDRQPVTYYNQSTKSFEGVAITMLQHIGEKTGLKFRFVPITTQSPVDMLKTTDLLMPVPKTSDAGSYFTTPSLMDAEILFAVRDGAAAPNRGDRVAVLSNTPGINRRVEDLGLFQLVKYPDSRSALAAVQAGEVAAYANASYVLNWGLENPRFNDLRILHYQRLNMNYELCGKAQDKLLRSILNKGIRQLTDKERANIIREHTAFSVEDLTLEDKLHIYSEELFLGLLFVVALGAGIVFYNRSRTRYIKEIESRSLAAEQANRAKSDFLARMSHDMRTPMNGILGLAALMKDEDRLPKLRADLQQLELSGQYLLRLINDTLDMSKIEAGKLELHREPINSEGVFKNVLANAAQLAAKHQVQLVVQAPAIAPGEWATVMADASRLEQIMMNIISNAIKFTPAGGQVTLKMETVSVTADRVVDRYTVTDTGIGISKEFLPHIFEAFSQEGRANTDHESGTGLGMPIVKQLVDMMGGQITITSELNKGTSISVLMPYEVAKGVAKANDTTEVDTGVLQGKRVLLCEDHPLNRQIACRLLNKVGMVVETAENGQQGVECFRASAPGYYAAVLMDIRMPIMNGLEATAAIRALPNRDAATVPILAMTANAYAEDVEKSLQAGMNAHLAKPIVPKKLYATLVELIKK